MKFIKTVLLLAIFTYIFYGFDFAKLHLDNFLTYNVLLTISILFLGQIILSIRFMKIISLKFKPAYETIVISNALNMFLPARLGELSKVLYLKKFYNYNYDKGVASTFIERFFDVIMLLFVVLAWAYLYFTNDTIKHSILILSLSILLILFFFNSQFFSNLVRKLKFNFIKNTYLAINQLLKKSPIFLFWSIVLWSCYLFSYWSFFDFLTFNQMLELFIFSTIALSIPLAPAGIGTFEGIIVFYLGNYGISKEEAFMFASIYHLLLFLVDFVMFYILLISKNITFDELKKL